MKNPNSFLIYLALAGILVFAWLTRWFRLGQPAVYVFDENYHVPAIRLIAENNPAAFEWWHPPIYGEANFDWLHPPLAKYIQATSYRLLPNAMGWRLPSAVFGVMGVALVFLVAQLAFRKPVVSLLAAFLLSLDGLWLVQSRVAMNDVFVSVWLLAAIASFLWFQRKLQPEWLLLVGLFGGLGLATKWSAIFWLSGIFIWQLIRLWQHKQIKQIPWSVFSLLVVPLMIYVITLFPIIWQGKTFGYLIEWHKQVLAYQLAGGGQHPAQSSPWQWWLNLAPILYWRNGVNQQIVAINNPLLAWLEVGATLFALSSIWLGKKHKSDALEFLVMIFLVTFLPWIVSPRITFYYHYTPAVPLAAILAAGWLGVMYLKNKTRNLKIAFFILLTSLVWVFWLYYPQWIGLPVSPAYLQTITITFPA